MLQISTRPPTARSVRRVRAVPLARRHRRRVLLARSRPSQVSPSASRAMAASIKMRVARLRATAVAAARFVRLARRPSCRALQVATRINRGSRTPTTAPRAPPAQLAPPAPRHRHRARRVRSRPLLVSPLASRATAANTRMAAAQQHARTAASGTSARPARQPSCRALQAATRISLACRTPTIAPLVTPEPPVLLARRRRRRARQARSRRSLASPNVSRA